MILIDTPFQDRLVKCLPDSFWMMNTRVGNCSDSALINPQSRPKVMWLGNHAFISGLM
jgi:hypothetical protein